MGDFHLLEGFEEKNKGVRNLGEVEVVEKNTVEETEDKVGDDQLGKELTVLLICKDNHSF